MDLNENDQLHPIQTIPQEIRGYIFNKLPQNEAIELRLVCLQWKQEVNNYFNFSIELDERCPFLHEILQLRITKLKIIKLTKYQIQSPHHQDQDPLRIVFKHPKIIQELHVTYENGLKFGIISVLNLHELLQGSEKSLKVLCLCLRAEHLNHHLFPANMSYDFQNLKKVRISIRSGLRLPPPDITWNNCLLSQISNSRIPKLRSLDIENSSRDLTTAIIPLFKLTTKNPNGLEHLTIALGGSDGTFLPMKDLTALNILNLKTLSLDLVPISQEELNFWSNLISNQRNLRRVQISEGFVLPNSLLRSIVLNNYDTIVYIQVDLLDLNTAGPLDLSLFKSCSNLEALTLTTDNAPRVETPDLINLSELPQSILYLHLIHFRISARDILDFLNSDLVNGLKVLYIYNYGVRGEIEMSSEISENILRIEKTKNSSVILINGFDVAYPD